MKKEIKYIIPTVKVIRLSGRVSICAMSGGTYNPISGDYDDDSD